MENKWDVKDTRWSVASDGYTVCAEGERGESIRIVTRAQTVVIARQIAEEHNAALEAKPVPLESERMAGCFEEARTIVAKYLMDRVIDNQGEEIRAIAFKLFDAGGD